MVSSGGLEEGAISDGDGADIGGNTVANNDADDGDDGNDGGDGSDAAAADRVAPLITRHTRCWSRVLTGHERTGAETGRNRPSRLLSVRRRWVGAGIYAIS